MQLASLVQKHSHRTLAVKFVGPWRVPHESPTPKIAMVRSNCRTWIFKGSPAFAVAPLAGNMLFHRGSWDDIRIRVFQEAGFEDARAIDDAFRTMTHRNVEIVKTFE
ncbi:MAG TPA: hypothetical protein VG326_10230 [Tepidisphaeraceae bacterium]|nr:hypothetical protein [Tepidisphaeraceae bacterium]